MIVKHYSEVSNQAVDVEGAVAVKKRVLIGEKDGAPNFVMRQFTLEAGGKTPFHTHNWEHEVYVLSGTGIARHSGGESDISAGYAVLVLPNEEHGFVNTGNEPLVFLCSIPKL